MSLPPETARRRLKRAIIRMLCGFIGHGRLTLSTKGEPYVDVCPHCDKNFLPIERKSA